jgi:hypothetical protein
VKLGWKALNLYNEKKKEFSIFESYYEELSLRIEVSEPIIIALENQLTPHLAIVLGRTQHLIEELKQYCDDLLEYCQSYRGLPLRMIADSVIQMTKDTFTDPMIVNAANAFASKFSLRGFPEKAFEKYEKRLQFLLVALTAAIGAQNLQTAVTQKNSQSPNPSSGPVTYSKVESQDMENGAALQMVNLQLNDGNPKPAKPPKPPAKPPKPASLSMERESLPALPTTLTSEEIQKRLIEMCKEEMASSTKDVDVILIDGLRTNIYKPWIFGVWLDKVPHLLLVRYVGSLPKNLFLCRAPSTFEYQK